MNKIKPIYGPVNSWRLGNSLGVDPICQKKTCSFDCLYCQYGETTKKTIEREEFIDKNFLATQFDILKNSEIDNVTFAGTGEPTLAKNLDDLIMAIKENTSKPVAILTNSSFLTNREVRNTLMKFDKVLAKLDVSNQKYFRKINEPHSQLDFEDMFLALKDFSRDFMGFFAIQSMFMKKNKDQAKQVSKLTRELETDQIQINTPLRKSRATTLDKKEINNIKSFFEGNVIDVYNEKSSDSSSDRKINS